MDQELKKNLGVLSDHALIMTSLILILEMLRYPGPRRSVSETVNELEKRIRQEQSDIVSK